jgi:hypothetical protein
MIKQYGIELPDKLFGSFLVEKQIIFLGYCIITYMVLRWIYTYKVLR